MIFFNKLVRKYKDAAKYPKSVKKQNKTISKIISMITNNFSITLDDIAKKLGYNISYCSRYIKNHTNYNFSPSFFREKNKKNYNPIFFSAFSLLFI